MAMENARHIHAAGIGLDRLVDESAEKSTISRTRVDFSLDIPRIEAFR